MFEFSITASDGQARTGQLVTPHGTVETPCFMPVGTHGAVKGVSPQELNQVGSQVVLANTYHMCLRPGESLVQELGGVHTFTGWNGPMLTDSGGFQVFSLGERGMAGTEKQALRRVSEDGVTFQSHLDGSRHMLTPEKSLQVQRALGADIAMAFDQPVYGMSGEVAANEAMERSMRWLERSIQEWRRGNTDAQALFGIVQGGIHTVLHRRSAEEVARHDLPGNAIGGLSVGEGKNEMWAAVESINEILPVAKPRYFMGLGEPRDLVDAVLRGVDMFDCVSPTRLARHGAVWMPIGDEASVAAFWKGDAKGILDANTGIRFERWNLNNAKFRQDARVFGVGETQLSLGALNHYLKEHEMLAYRILSLHNIRVLHAITECMRDAIRLEKTTTFTDLIA